MLVHVNYINPKGASKLVDLDKYLIKHINRLNDNHLNYYSVFGRTYKGKTYIKNTPLFFDVDNGKYNEKFIEDCNELILEYFRIKSNNYVLKQTLNKYHIYFTDVIVSKKTISIIGQLLIKKGWDVDTHCFTNLTRMEGFTKFKDNSWVHGSEYKNVNNDPINIEFYRTIYNFNSKKTKLIKILPVFDNVKKPKHIRKEVIEIKINADDEIIEWIKKTYKVLRIYYKNDMVIFHVDISCPNINEKHISNNVVIEYFPTTRNIFLTCTDKNCKKFRLPLYPPLDTNGLCLIDLIDDIDYFSLISKSLDEFNNVYMNTEHFIKLNSLDFGDKDKDNNYPIIKKYIEQFYFKINTPDCYLDTNGNQVNVKHILQNYHCKYNSYKKKDDEIIVKQHPLVGSHGIWTNDIHIRTYDTYGFYPPPLIPKKNFYNVFKHKQYYSNINRVTEQYPEKMIYHFEEMVCNGDKQLISFFINYMYHLVMYPAQNPQVMIILYSKIVGAGKNTYPYMLKRLMGDVYFDEVEGEQYFNDNKFNEIEYRKILLIINEGSASKKSVVESLKARITNEKKSINRKNEKQIQVINCTRYISTSNQFNSFAFVGKSRRLVGTEVNDSKAGDTNYFNSVYKEIANDECIKGFWNYILDNIDINDKIKIDTNCYNFQNNRPITQYYEDLAVSNTDNFTKFLGYVYDKIIKGDKNDEEFVDIKSSFMRTELIDFTKKITDEKYTIQHTTMINKFKQIKFKNQYCIISKKMNGIRIYRINVENLKNYFILNYPHFFKQLDDYIGNITESLCYI